MRFLLTTNPSSGHFHPLVPLAQALRGAGHEVAFATAESFRPVVEALGMPLFAAGLDRTSDDAEFVALKQKARRLGPGFEINQLGVAEVLYGVRARRMVPDLFAVFDRWRPDVVIHESFEAAGAVVAEARGLPHASVAITPLFDLEPMRRAIDHSLARARSVAGLTADRGMIGRYLVLCFAPPGLVDDSRPRPATRHHLRPTFFDRSEEEPAPDWIDALGTRPTVYVTFGTVANQWRGDAFTLLRRIVEGLRDKVDVVLTVGRDNDPGELGTQPANVRVERYIPQSLLLPRCRAVVSHGGFNTVLAAIDAGLPQLLVPLLADDPCNARRCAELGLARTLSPAEVTVEAVAEAADDLLRSPRYTANARRMQAELHDLPELDTAVGLLERLALGRTITRRPEAIPSCG